VAAIHEDGELDRPRTPQVDEPVEGRPDRPAREEHVIDENHDLSFDLERDLRPPQHRVFPDVIEIVAVQVDVQNPDRDGSSFDLADLVAQTVRERNAARLDPDQPEPLRDLVLLEDLVRDP
jgi:hypothetical protein